MYIKNDNFVAHAQNLYEIWREVDYFRIVTPANFGELKRQNREAVESGEYRPPTPKFIYDTKYLEFLRDLRRDFEVERKFFTETVSYISGVFSPKEQFVARLLRHRLDELNRLFLLATEMSRWNPAPPKFELDAYGCYRLRKIPIPGYPELAPDEQTVQICLLTAQDWRPSDQKRRAKNEAILDASGIADHFNSALSRYGAEGWRAEVSDVAVAITVKSEQELVVVPSGRAMSETDCRKLIAHEIDGHVRAHLNTRAWLSELVMATFGSPGLPLVPMLAKSDDALFNEGVAKLNEVAVAGESALPHPFYVVAANLANHDICFVAVAREIYHLAAKWKKPLPAADFAWDVTCRVFRGGGSYLPTVYWQGYQLAEILARANRKRYEKLASFASLSIAELLRAEAGGFLPEAKLSKF